MNLALDLSEDYLRRKYPAAKLLLPTGGILSGVTRLVGEHTAPDFEIAVSNLDNLTHIFPHVSLPNGLDAFNEPLGGAGADVDPELAWLRAVMEGGERYANMAYREEDFVFASARELGELALDLDTLPRCSEKEYADPKCPYVPADKHAAIRWTRGYSLTGRCERMVPSVMAHLYLKPAPKERFWQEISTGCAAHVRLEAALVSAICEVIERDAIAMTWLAKLPLPRIEMSEPLPVELVDNHRVLRNGLVQQHFFDATTDVGIPTIYAVQLLDGHPQVAQYVNCAVGFNAAEACAKIIREAAPARAVLSNVKDVPDNVEDFRSLYDGAHHLGKPEWRHAFNFLLETPNRKSLSDIQVDAPADEQGQLRFLLDRLKAMGMEVVAVDLTTDELRELGIWVVRVVIPGLMPMSSVQRGRFLGHPRLYEYPRHAGYGALTEETINPIPQPFA
ncbi:YcaO-like family protein [Microbulbifer sp. 2205BS26-8]|uniref:YcaO-like family protein n=1 Tax=Microbulbifer sp. 2205BS26-8 TaxID=3064386 RepID=UPI00273FF73E|nr:YcaO-like family protein [Microbulbifer sp. 2205BS26-8]MDP5210778.1 YcaO-like family protein [Microbulbifer sp. 2205BS26-8]